MPPLGTRLRLGYPLATLGCYDIKDMYVDSGGREMVPFLEVLDTLVKRGVEVRFIHAKDPGPNWREKYCRECGRRKFCSDPAV